MRRYADMSLTEKALVNLKKRRKTEYAPQITERWTTLKGFIEDMGERPSADYVLFRRDSSKPYCKENCEWALRAVTRRIASTCTFMEYEGQRLCLTDWAERLGTNRQDISNRLRRGWSPERVVSFYEAKRENLAR